MSSQKNTPPNKDPNRKGPPERFQPKVLLIWLVIISAIVALWFAQPGAAANAQRLTISELVTAVKEGQITKGDGVMKPDPSLGEAGYIITGQMSATPEGSEIADGNAAATVPFTAEGRLTEADFLLVREVLAERRSSTAMQDILISFLPCVLIIGLLYFLFVRQLKNAGRGAMSFGKSKAKMLTRDKDAISFKDVAGCDEAKEEVSEVVDFL